MFIAVVNQKGGVGKSTLAVHLAIWLNEQGEDVAFIDADGQGTSSRWISIAAPDIPLIRQTHPDDILETGRRLMTSTSYVVADGPASLAESTRALLLIADLALVPCGSTVPELESTAETLRILKNAQAVRRDGKPTARVVLSRMRSNRFVLSRESRDAASALGLPVCQSTLGLREAAADAAGQRTVVWHMGQRARTAAREMLDLMEEVKTYVHDQTEYRGDHHPRAAAVSA